MKKLFYLLFFSISFAFSQDNLEGEVNYLDFKDNPTSKSNATYYEFKTPYKNEIYKYQKYFIASATKAYLIEKYFYYQEDNKQGKYQSFRKDGSKKEEGYYKDDLKNGPWVLYWLKKNDSSINNETYLYKKSIYVNNLRNGSFKELYEDGSTQGEGFYKNNNFDKECMWYHPNGQLSSLETYNEKGKLIEIKQWDENGVERTKKLKANHDISSRRDQVQNRIIGILSQKVKYPSEGKAYFHVFVDKQGKFHLLEIETTYPNSENYREKAKQVIKNLKPIEPFLYHNQLTEVSLKFYLIAKAQQTIIRTNRVYKTTIRRRKF